MIDICYDGSQFEGFAPQPHKRTVYDTLIAKLNQIYKCKMTAYGSSRTDSKVSAKTQLIVYDAPFEINTDNIVRAINSGLNEAIYCKSAVYVKEGYMPRHEVASKTYIYTISKHYDPFTRNFEHVVPHELNINAMEEAANYLIGKHDFSSFCSANTDVNSKVRTIHSININYEYGKTKIEVSGDGFLYNMVRIISGTLIVFGLEKYDPSLMEDILKSKDRSKAFATAPAKGLCLEKIVLKGNDEEK